MHLDFWLPANFLLLVCRKNVSGAYIVSAHFGKQHINLVNPIIDFSRFSSLVDWPMHEKGVSTSILWIQKISFFLIMAWEPIFSQRWMLARHAASKLQWSTVIVVINNSLGPRGFLGQWIKISLKNPTSPERNTFPTEGHGKNSNSQNKGARQLQGLW
jgi:hypothetical protein